MPLNTRLTLLCPHLCPVAVTALSVVFVCVCCLLLSCRSTVQALANSRTYVDQYLHRLPVCVCVCMCVQCSSLNTFPPLCPLSPAHITNNWSDLSRRARSMSRMDARRLIRNALLLRGRSSNHASSRFITDSIRSLPPGMLVMAMTMELGYEVGVACWGGRAGAMLCSCHCPTQFAFVLSQMASDVGESESVPVH